MVFSAKRRRLRASTWLRLYVPRRACHIGGTGAFSSEVDTGSREENASKQESRVSVLIQSEPIML
jgi:hypothetical protein